MRAAKGFTLFELLVVMVIAAIVTAFTAPGLGAMAANSRVNGAANELEAALAFAKSQAAFAPRRNVVVTMTATGGVVTGWAVRQSTVPVSVTGPIIQSYQLNLQSRVTTTVFSAVAGFPSTGAAIANFQFTPTGMLQRMDTTPPSAVALTLRICDANSETERGRFLTINQRGRVLSVRDMNPALCNP